MKLKTIATAVAAMMLTANVAIAGGNYIVNTNSGNLLLRSGAGTNYRILARMPKGSHVYVNFINGNWANVTYNGVRGYASAQYLKPAVTPTPNPPAPINNRSNIKIPTIINNPIVTPVVREDRVCKLSNGWYNIVSANAPGRCVDVQSSGNTDGVNVLLFDNNNTNNQKFYLENTSDGYFTLRPGHSSTHRLDAYGGYSTNGTNIHIYTNNGTDAQKWRLIDAGNGTYWIESKLRKKLNFDCAGGGMANGTNIQLWEREDVNWHKWKFVSTSAPVIATVNSTNIKGDVNNDGRVDEKDSDLLIRYLGKVITSGVDIKNADMNNDGIVDITDHAQLMMKLYPEKFSKSEQKNNNDIQVPFTKMSTNFVICYDNINGKQQGWIDRGDNVTIEKINGDWAYGNYPAGGGKVSRWFKYGDFTRDVPENMSIMLNVPYYKQTDSRWSGVYIGSKTIGQIGCTTTCLAMKYEAQFGMETRPDVMKTKLSYSNNDLLWNSIKKFGFLQRSYTNINNNIMRDIHSNLKNGRPVIIGAYKNANGEGQHWVVIVGYDGHSLDSVSTSDFIIHDPNNENNKRLNSFINNRPYIKGYIF